MPTSSFNPERKIVVNNFNEYGGNVVGGFGLNLLKNEPFDSRRGEMFFDRKMLQQTAGSNLVNGFVYTNADKTARWWATADRLKKTSLISTAFANDTLTGTPTDTQGDIIPFGKYTGTAFDQLIAARDNDLAITRDGSPVTWQASWWTDVVGSGGLAQPALESTVYHPLAVFYPLSLLFVGDGYKLHSIDSSTIAAGVVNSRFVFPKEYVISWIRCSDSQVFCGVYDSTGKTSSGVWVCDPVNGTAVFVPYGTNGAQAGAGTMFRNLLYVLTPDGHIKYFNGLGFEEITSTPFSKYCRLQDGLSVHQNGLIADENRLYFATPGITNNLKVLPGVYIYDFEDGNLYHHMPFCTKQSDAGQWMMGNSAGAIFSDGINILACVNRYDSGSDIFRSVTGSADITFRGNVLLPKIASPDIRTSWVKAWLKWSAFNSETVLLKYRTAEYVDGHVPESGGATATWLSTTSFTTTSNLSKVLVGHEMVISTGIRSGFTAHVTSISLAGSTYTVVIDEAITGLGATSIVFFMPFFKAGTYTADTLSASLVSLISGKNVSEWVQLKLEMRGSTSSIRDVVLVSAPNIKAE